MYVKKAKLGGFLLPGEGEEKKLDLNGVGGKLFTLRLSIPSSKESFDAFCVSMNDSENNFVEKLKNKQIQP